MSSLDVADVTSSYFAARPTPRPRIADDFDEVLPVLADQEYVNMLGCDSAMSRT
jgi:hypothetical protein